MKNFKLSRAVIAAWILIYPSIALSDSSINKVEKISENQELVNLESAFNALIEDKPLAALDHLEKLDKKKPEVLAGRLFASFELNSWKETVELYKELPKTYQSLDGFQSIAIESYIALGNMKEAESMLNKLLKMPPEPDIKKYPEYFQKFQQEKLNTWNRYYVAAFYYKIVKNDFITALEYFKKINHPTLVTEVEIAETYLETNNLQEAGATLNRVLHQLQESETEKKLKIRILGLLGEVEVKSENYIQALLYFREYFALNPDDYALRILYAQIFMKLQRFDLALDQFKKAGKFFKATSSTQIDVIECLVRTNKFEEANQMARDWISQEQVPLVYQIKIARFMIITKYQQLLDTILSKIAEKEVRTIEENQQLILLWLDLGDFDKAHSLANSIQRSLEATPNGLLILAELYSKLSNNEKAQEFTEMAFQSSEGKPSTRKLLEKYEKNIVSIAKDSKILREKLEKDSENIELNLSYVKNLIELGIDSYSSGETKELALSTDLQTAKQTIEKLIKNNKEIPEIYFLQGKIFYLLDKNKEAMEAYQNALKLDVSYVDAYQYLALAEEEIHQENQAIASAENAAKFAPSNAKIWLQLGELLSKQNRFSEAIKVLEKAKKYAPNSPISYIKLGENYLSLKKPELALPFVDAALEISPKNLSAIKLMLLVLYNDSYVNSFKDKQELNKRRLKYLDKIQAISPEEAENIRKRLGIL